MTILGVEIVCIELNEGIYELVDDTGEDVHEVRVGALDPSDEGGRLILTPHET